MQLYLLEKEKQESKFISISFCVCVQCLSHFCTKSNVYNNHEMEVWNPRCCSCKCMQASICFLNVVESGTFL